MVNKLIKFICTCDKPTLPTQQISVFLYIIGSVSKLIFYIVFEKLFALISKVRTSVNFRYIDPPGVVGRVGRSPCNLVGMEILNKAITSDRGGLPVLQSQLS